MCAFMCCLSGLVLSEVAFSAFLLVWMLVAAPCAALQAERPDIHLVLRCQRAARRAPLFDLPPPRESGAPEVARAVRWSCEPMRGPLCPSFWHPPMQWSTVRRKRKRKRSKRNRLAHVRCCLGCLRQPRDCGGGTRSGSLNWVPVETRRCSAPRRGASAYFTERKRRSFFAALGRRFSVILIFIIFFSS